MRHADAGRRAADQPDDLRPLTDRGHAQAATVADALARLDVRRIVSSRYVRCVQTVLPLADKLGVSVQTHAALAEEADLDHTWSLLEDAATWPGDVVLCSHGNVIPPLLDRLRRRGIELVADELSCHKGSIWTVDVDGAGVARAVLALARP